MLKKQVNLNNRNNAGLGSLVTSFANDMDAVNNINKKLVSYFGLKSNYKNNTPSSASPPLYISLQIIRKALCVIKNKFHCKDNVNDFPSYTLKISSEIICPYISIIFNECLKQSRFPKAWKDSLITAIPKSKQVTINNLRPISILPIMSKLFEKCILMIMAKDLYKLFDGNQFGFRNNSSTQCALITLQSYITQSMDTPNNGSTIMISFDISKAFDMVNHDKLIETLITNDVSNHFVQLINSYLQDRTQRVTYKSIFSEQLPINSGVPQGSVLGPVLFNIYIASLKPHNNSTKYVKFADDSTFLLTIPKSVDMLDAIKSEIDHVGQWCFTYGLSLNNSKTKIMAFTKSRTKELKFDLKDLNTYLVTNLKILGFTFDMKLNWHSHIDILLKTLSSRIHIFRLLKHSLTKAHLINLYFGIFQSLSFGL